MENRPAHPDVCPHCQEAGTFHPVSYRLLRCTACGFFAATARSSVPESRAAAGPPGLAGTGQLFRGKYRLLELLGTGPRSLCYLARHEYLGHLCAVKLIPRPAGADEGIARQRSAARAAFGVRDAGVLRVMDCDFADEAWFFVSEYCEGVPLALLTGAKHRLHWQQVVQIAGDVLRGLAAIHSAGLRHGNLTPGNLILGVDGRVRIADLGVAAVVGEATLPPVGALPYTAPERIRRATADARADFYALGAVLFQLLTGRSPQPAAGVYQRLLDAQCRPVLWPSDGPAEVPDWLIRIVLRMLAIDSAERFATAGEVLRGLRSARDQPAPSAAPAMEVLEPRGVGVLPFENERVSPDDDWLGYAVANYLARALAESGEVYVADSDALAELVARERAGRRGGDGIVEAGRLVGAAKVVTGRFLRDGRHVRLRAAVLCAGPVGTLPTAQVAGELADLGSLERALFEQLARVLGLLRTERVRPQPAALAAREKLVLGKQAYLRGQYESAIALAEEAVRLEPELGEALGFAGVCLARLGRYEEAEAYHRRQEEIARRAGDARREIEALANLGVMNYYRGEYESAEEQLRRASELADQVGLATEGAMICNNLGFVLFRRGRPVDAEQAFRRAIEAHRAYGGLAALVGPYSGMGNVLAEQQRYEEAGMYYRRALALATEVGDRTSVGTAHMHLGRCAAQEGRFADARHEFAMALNTLEETRFWNGLARVYEYVADLHLQLGNLDEAARCADKRIELARQHANTRMEAAAWQQKAEALRRAGRTEAAAECLAAAGSSEVAVTGSE